MRLRYFFIGVFVALFMVACSGSSSQTTQTTKTHVLPCQQVDVMGTGTPATTPDWIYDFTQQNGVLDTTVWTPEVTMSGEGNFEFEAYLYSPSTIGLDPTNGLVISPNTMDTYTVDTSSQHFYNISTGTVTNPGENPNNPTWPQILGCNRNNSPAVPFAEAALGGCRSTTSLEWVLDTSGTCTDNGSAFAIPYNTCQATSGISTASGIGSAVPDSRVYPNGLQPSCTPESLKVLNTYVCGTTPGYAACTQNSTPVCSIGQLANAQYGSNPPTLVTLSTSNVSKFCSDGSMPTCSTTAPLPIVWHKTGQATTMIPPVISGRISTKQAVQPASGYDISKGFLYGRMEITAQIPQGDWLWPAMWMMPMGQTEAPNPSNPAGTGAYGVWPRSGEIDILESRGNSASCSEDYIVTQGGAFGGTQSFASTLHWGPVYSENAFAKTHTEFYSDFGYGTKHSGAAATQPLLSSDFFIYGLRWSPSGLYTYIRRDPKSQFCTNNPTNMLCNGKDTNHVLEVDFTKKDFYTRGNTLTGNCLQKYSYKNGAINSNYPSTCDTPVSWPSNSWASNPWEASSQCNPNAAPFNQPFYLILNLAIGGTAGEGTTAYFPDGWCTKPWHNPTGSSDSNSFPVANFLTAQTKGNSFSGPNYSGWFPSWNGGQKLKVKHVKYWQESNAGAFGALSNYAS